MKTPTVIRLFALSTLACTALLLAGCGQPAEEKDTGPNATLSNDALLKKAIVNMKAMDSYHFEFRGGIPSESVKMSQNMTISADMQLNGKGSRVKFGDESPATVGPNPDSVILNTGNVDMIIVEDHRPYLSYDGGKTWTTYGVDTPEDYLMAMFGSLWIPHDFDNGEAYGEQMLRHLSFSDGSPRIERVDDVITRHMVVNMPESEEQPEFPRVALQGAKGVSLWVSTELAPTIRQMKVEGSNTVEKQETPFTLTWTWNRFNEDFGEIKPPPTETSKSP
jgi:hypothetical protein